MLYHPMPGSWPQHHSVLHVTDYWEGYFYHFTPSDISLDLLLPAPKPPPAKTHTPNKPTTYSYSTAQLGILNLHPHTNTEF